MIINWVLTRPAVAESRAVLLPLQQESTDGQAVTAQQLLSGCLPCSSRQAWLNPVPLLTVKLCGAAGTKEGGEGVERDRGGSMLLWEML